MQKLLSKHLGTPAQSNKSNIRAVWKNKKTCFPTTALCFAPSASELTTTSQNQFPHQEFWPDSHKKSLISKVCIKLVGLSNHLDPSNAQSPKVLVTPCYASIQFQMKQVLIRNIKNHFRGKIVGGKYRWMIATPPVWTFLVMFFSNCPQLWMKIATSTRLTLYPSRQLLISLDHIWSFSPTLLTA